MATSTWKCDSQEHEFYYHHIFCSSKTSCSSLCQGCHSVKALAFHHCHPDMIRSPGTIYGVSLMVLYSGLQDFFPGAPAFPYPQSEPIFDLIWFNLIYIELHVCLSILAKGPISPNQFLSLSLMPIKEMNGAIHYLTLLHFPLSFAFYHFQYPREQEWAAAYVR